MGRRTLPDDKVVNALSIARYNATYHSNLSTALLNSSLFQFISKCAVLVRSDYLLKYALPEEQFVATITLEKVVLLTWRNDRLQFQ
jgi:hypothetical protein